MYCLEHKKNACKFIELLLESEVLKFGSFVTKSGRETPYFFNTGNLCSGKIIAAISELYSDAIISCYGESVTNLFGPAYKGIPLCVTAAQRLACQHELPVTYTFNRKEAKDHGEGGSLIGHIYEPGDTVIIVEDVLTGGTSIRQTLDMFKDIDAKVVGAVVGIDRQEKGKDLSSSRSALQEIEDEYGITIEPIVNLDLIVEFLHGKEVLGKIWIDDNIKQSIESYRDTYGA